MKALLELVVRRPVAVTMVVLAVVVFGLVSLTRLPVNLLPDVSYPTLTVRTEYAGAAPIDVEKLVTRRLEENLAVIGNLVSFWSTSRAGFSDIVLEFEWGTPMTFATQDVREKVDQVAARLPEGVEQPLTLRYDPTLDPVMRLALYPRPEYSREDGSHLYELRRHAEEDLQRQIETLPGVAAVQVRGGFEEEWRIELDEALLKQHDMPASVVADRVATENVNAAGGILRSGDRELLVRSIGEFVRIEELAELVVGVRNGKPVRVRDLGRVVAGRKERDVISRVEGRESVEVEIYKEAGANVVDVARVVKSRLFGADWEARLHDGTYVPKPAEQVAPTEGEASVIGGQMPVASMLATEGIETRVLSDQSVFIQRSLDEVRNAGLLGALLAVFVLYTFLRRIGPTLIISLAIPISVIATFAPLYLAGVSLNIMSLGGLALGVGMLVDSAIVVLEAITRRREEGEPRVEAAVSGTREVGLAVLASTVTTIAVFLPIVFVEGIAGEFFRDQALAVVFSLTAALLAALFFIPMCAALGGGRTGTLAGARAGLRHVLPWAIADWQTSRSLGALWRRPDRGLIRKVLGTLPEVLIRLPIELVGRCLGTGLLGIALLAAALVGLPVFGVLWLLRWPLALFDRVWRLVEAGYLRLVSAALAHRMVVLVVAAAFSAWAFSRTGDLGVELVPKVHQGEFTIETQLPVGTPVAATDRVGRAITESVREALAEQDIAVAGIASASGVSREVIAKAGDGKHTSRVHVRLSPTDDLSGLEERAIGAIRRRLATIPEVPEPIFTRPALFTSETAIEIQLIGPDLQRIQAAAGVVEQRLRESPIVSDVQSTHRAGHPELVIHPDRAQLAFHGLHAGDMAALVRDKILGRIATRVTRGDRKIDVRVRVPEQDLDERSKILGLRVNPAGERPIPLGAVAQVDQRPGPAEIRRVGGERAVVLSAEVAGADLLGAADDIQTRIAELRETNPGLFDGVTVRVGGQSEESRRSVGALLGALLIAVFLVYIVLASQFESLVHPFVILFSIPLALVGVILTLDFLEVEVSVVVLIGVILLAGIVVNNAIVLVDCVNRLRREGASRDAALREAGRLRLRPIIMTTATTVLGLLPLAIGLGEGTEIRAPMAVTVIAGLTMSTLLTLVVVPVVYSLVSGPGPITAGGEEQA